jgi:HK97 family phage portal protein
MAKSRVGQLFSNATSNAKNPAAWLLQSLGLSNKSDSGIPVTINTVLGIPEVWMAVSKISGHISQMEVQCMEYDDTDEYMYSKPARNDAGANLIKNPSEFFNKATLMEKWIIDTLIYGNGRLYIERNAQGQPVGLYPLQAEACTTVVAEGVRWHTVTIDSSTEVGNLKSKSENRGTMYRLPDKDVLYLMGLTRNGWWGENPLSILRDSFGLSIAGQEASGATFRNAGRPGLLLEAPRGAFRSAKESQEFLEQFNSAHEGLDKTGKTGMIREGMKAQVLPNDTNTSGYVQQRQFQRESTAMIFLLESVFGDNTGSTYKSVTERNAAYVTNCLGRWINKIEDELNSKLLSVRKKASGKFGYKLDTSCLFKHDKLSLAQYTTNLRLQNMISGNEVRELHGLKPVPDLVEDYNPQAAAALKQQEIAHEHGVEMQEKQHQQEKESSDSDKEVKVPEQDDRSKDSKESK